VAWWGEPGREWTHPGELARLSKGEGRETSTGRSTTTLRGAFYGSSRGKGQKDPTRRIKLNTRRERKGMGGGKKAKLGGKGGDPRHEEKEHLYIYNQEIKRVGESQGGNNAVQENGGKETRRKTQKSQERGPKKKKKVLTKNRQTTMKNKSPTVLGEAIHPLDQPTRGVREIKIPGRGSGALERYNKRGARRTVTTHERESGLLKNKPRFTSTGEGRTPSSKKAGGTLILPD